MHRPPSFIRTLLWNQLLWLIPILTAMMSPILFMAGLGVWGLFSDHERFLWFWDRFWLCSAIAFLAVLLFCLAVRQWRLPRRSTPEREAAARKVVEDFVRDFPYEKLTFTDQGNILNAILDLNARVARVYGIRSKNPELDIPLSYALLLVDRISADLTRKLAGFRTGDLTQKLTGVHWGDQPLLDWVKLSHLLWFLPSSSKTRTGKKRSGGWMALGRNSASASTSRQSADTETAEGEVRAKGGIRIQGMRYAVRKVFPILFQIVGDYSVLLYGGKFQLDIQDSQRSQDSQAPPAAHSERSAAETKAETPGRFSSVNVFFHSRLATPQWMAFLYAGSLFACLCVGGVLFPLEKAYRTVPESQSAESLTSESQSSESQSSASQELASERIHSADPEPAGTQELSENGPQKPAPFTREWMVQIAQKHGLVILAGGAALGFIFFWLKNRTSFPLLTIAPDPRWLKKEREAFENVQKTIDSLKVQELEGIPALLRSVRHIIEQVDREYSGRSKPAYSISLAELLQAQRILVGRLQKMLAREFPGMDYLRLRDLRFGLKLYGAYVWTFGIYRRVLWFDPVSAGVLELRRSINQKILKFYSRQFGVGSALCVLELAGFYAVELYSGLLFWKEEEAGPIRIGVRELTPESLRKHHVRKIGEAEQEARALSADETVLFSDFIPETDGDGWSVESFAVAKTTWTNFVPFRRFFRETECGTEPAHADVLVLLSRSRVTPEEKAAEEKSLTELREFWEELEAKPLLVRILHDGEEPENAAPSQDRIPSASRSPVHAPSEENASPEDERAQLPVRKRNGHILAERQTRRWVGEVFSRVSHWLDRAKGSKNGTSVLPKRVPSALSEPGWQMEAGPLWKFGEDPESTALLREELQHFLLENRAQLRLSQERRFLTAYRSRHRR